MTLDYQPLLDEPIHVNQGKNKPSSSGTTWDSRCQPMLDEPIHVNQGKNKTSRAGKMAIHM